MLGPSLTLSNLVISAVCAALMIGVGFLARPGRATVIWSTVFVIYLAAAVGAVVATQTDAKQLWLASMGVLFGTPALVWAGLRAYRGEPRTYAWIGGIVMVAAVVFLELGAGTPGFHLTGRVLFFLSALFNIAVIRELLRRPFSGRGVAMPLILVSGAWIVLAAIGVAAGALNIQSNYSLLTQSNSLALVVYQICALVTLLFLSRGAAAASTATGVDRFEAVARDRLSRAEAADEHTWILLDVRLDDAQDLKDAIGESGYAQVSTRFHAAVRSAFPADADIGAIDDSQTIVLIARTSSTVRSGIRQLMDELVASARDTADVLHVSASVGWADVTTSGYDLDALRAAAADHAVAAIAEGGGRWKRD